MKISSWAIYVCGLFLGLPLLAFGYFMHYQPETQEASDTEKAANDFRTEGAKLKKADERRHNARTLVMQAASEWNQVASVRTPPTGVNQGYAPDLSVNAYQLVVDTRKYRDSLQKAINTQLHAAGVTVINGGFVPEPDLNSSNSILQSFYNYTTFGFPIVILNLGQIQVQGKSYKQIFDHVKAWTNFPHYLAVTDSLALTGTTPNITGTYNLTIVGFIRATNIFPPMPEVQTTGNTSPFGGGAGGAGPSAFGGNPFGGGRGTAPNIPGGPPPGMGNAGRGARGSGGDPGIGGPER